MEKNEEINLLISNKYNLSERSIGNILEQIYTQTGIDAICYETPEGYIFKDQDYHIPIGELIYDKTLGDYRKTQLYSGGIREVSVRNQERKRIEAQERKQERERKRRRRFALQVGKVAGTGLLITALGITALTKFGVIDSPFQPHTPTEVVAVSEEKNLNTLNNANDILLVEWMNYAVGEARDMCSDSEYEYFDTLSHEVYSEYFAPAMTAYYNYLDYKDAGIILSQEYSDTDYITRAHDAFKARTMEFAEYLQDSVYFNKITFESSPFANAIVTDAAGNVLKTGGIGDKEVIGVDGSIATLEDTQIKIRLNDLPNSPYSLENLPEDAQIINGEVYIDASHMNETLEAPSTPGK